MGSSIFTNKVEVAQSLQLTTGLSIITYKSSNNEKGTILILPEENVGRRVFLRNRHWSSSAFRSEYFISFLGKNVFYKTHKNFAHNTCTVDTIQHIVSHILF